MIARAWGYFLLSFGAVLFALIFASWGVVSVVLRPILPANTGRRVGRAGAMRIFRVHLATMEMAGAWRLDLGELDALRDAGPLIIAPNHPSLLDAAFVISRLPDTVCVMKPALLGNFLLGPAARLARYVCNDSLRRLVARAREEFALGGQLLLFPEATRSVGEPIGPLSEAVGALSRRTGVPVQVVVIEDGQRFLGKGWPLMRVPRFPLAYRIRLGPRFDPPRDVRAFTVELERCFTRELTACGAAAPVPEGSPALGSARQIRG